MAVENGSNGAWCDDTGAIVLLLSFLCFVSLLTKRLGDPVDLFFCCASVLDSQ